MTLRIVSILLLLHTTGHAQQAAPTPKKDPFAGFHSALDDKPGTSSQTASSIFDSAPRIPAPTQTHTGPASAGLKLNGRWESPLGLSRGGPSVQGKELHTLLEGFAVSGKDTGSFPDKTIYPSVTYLMPLLTAEAKLGLSGKLVSGGVADVVAFPDGLKFAEITAETGRNFAVRFLKDIADQVVAIEFVSLDANALPHPFQFPPQGRPQHIFQGRLTSDFVPQATNVFSKNCTQAAWDMGDFVLVSTRGGPKAADLYIPKPMVSLVLYCLERS